jgi:hypothetical protein
VGFFPFPGSVEQHFGCQIPNELFFQETVTLKHVGVMLHSIGHGQDAQEALAQYEVRPTPGVMIPRGAEPVREPLTMLMIHVSCGAVSNGTEESLIQ